MSFAQEYNTSDEHTLTAQAREPVVFGATGGSGEAARSAPDLLPFNLTLCRSKNDSGTVPNVGCADAQGVTRAPPAARSLIIDLRAVAQQQAKNQDMFFVRVQAYVRTRFQVLSVDASAHNWHLTVAESAAAELAEGTLVHATGASRRPLMVQEAQPADPEGANSTAGVRLKLVSHFSDGDGDITPDLTTLHGIEPHVDQIVSERWAWIQPTFRSRTHGGSLRDPFAGRGGNEPLW